MTQKEIRQRHQDIVRRRKQFNKNMEKLLLEWRQLQVECDHPNKFATNFMGDSGVHCPDCGYST